MEPVIVVGAGPTGLALALSLARHRVPSVVLDPGDGTAPARAARTCVLRPDTAACVPPLPGLRWRGLHIRRRRQVLRHETLASGEAPLHVEQHALEGALRTALAREPLVRVIGESRLDLLEQDPGGVTAHTRSPSADGGAHENGAWWRGSYLVGCDGARSTVRKLLNVRFTGRTAVERHAVAALRTRLPWQDEAVLHREADGADSGEVVARPLPAGVWRLDWLLPPDSELVTPEQLLERVHTTLSAWHGDGRRGGGEPGPYELLDTGVHTCHQRLARHWRVERAFLAGDAAHLLGALGVQSVDEGIRDAMNLAWKLSVAWHGRNGTDGTATEALLDSYETERRGAVGARLRAVDQMLPQVRRQNGGLRALLPASARAPLGLLGDGHLGRGPLGEASSHPRSPLLPARGSVSAVPVDTAPGGLVQDVPVTAMDGERAWLHGKLGGEGGELLVVLVAPGTGVWDSRHWLSAGMMPALADAVGQLPLRTELFVTEEYPGAAPHTVLVVRADGHLVTALPGARPEELRRCADTVRGAPPAEAVRRNR